MKLSTHDATIGCQHILWACFRVGRNPSFFCFYYCLFFSDKSCFYTFLLLQFLFFCNLKPFFLRRDFSSHFVSNKSCFSATKSFFIKPPFLWLMFKQNLFFPYSKINLETIGSQNLCYLLMKVVKFSSNSNLVLSYLITTVQKMQNS